MQKRQHEKSCEIKSGGPEVAVEKYLITFQVNFGADSQLGEATKICLKCCY